MGREAGWVEQPQAALGKLCLGKALENCLELGVHVVGPLYFQVDR